MKIVKMLIFYKAIFVDAKGRVLITNGIKKNADPAGSVIRLYPTACNQAAEAYPRIPPGINRLYCPIKDPVIYEG